MKYLIAWGVPVKVHGLSGMPPLSEAIETHKILHIFFTKPTLPIKKLDVIHKYYGYPKLLTTYHCATAMDGAGKQTRKLITMQE